VQIRKTNSTITADYRCTDRRECTATLKIKHSIATSRISVFTHSVDCKSGREVVPAGPPVIDITTAQNGNKEMLKQEMLKQVCHEYIAQIERIVGGHESRPIHQAVFIPIISQDYTFFVYDL
jgi:hypothetical protein